MYNVPSLDMVYQRRYDMDPCIVISLYEQKRYSVDATKRYNYPEIVYNLKLDRTKKII